MSITTKNRPGSQWLSRRRGLVAEIETLRSEYLNQLPEMRAAEEDALKSVRELHQALREAETKHREAQATARRGALRHGGQVTRLERELSESAPNVIDEFIGDMRNLTQSTQGTSPTIKLGKSNVESFKVRLAEIGRARLAAEALKLQALSVPETTESLAQIRSAIPAIGGSV